MRGTATIYLALKDEGVDVWRPVEATDQGGGIYRISDAPIPDRETWSSLLAHGSAASGVN